MLFCASIILLLYLLIVVDDDDEEEEEEEEEIGKDFFSIHWVKKKGFPFRGNIRETTWKPLVLQQQISMEFPSWKLPFSIWFPLKGNTLRSGLHPSIAKKLESTGGFPIWKIGGNYMETPGKHEGNHKETQVSQCKHKGNHMETSRFPM